jgi:uncharacterized protein
LAYAYYYEFTFRMTRPCKYRRVTGKPRSHLFKPCGVPFDELQEISLTLDELETIRLADLLGLYQEEAAVRMGVSRQTFGRIIANAHTKIADALIHGKILKIGGGTVTTEIPLKMECTRCRGQLEFAAEFENQAVCPHCKRNEMLANQTKEKQT